LADELTPTLAYSSRALPPDCPSRERFGRLAAQIRKAQGEAVARRTGQVWNVTSDAWAKCRGVQPVSSNREQTQTPKTPATSAEHDDLLAVGDALLAAGLRVVSPKFGLKRQETPLKVAIPRMNQTPLGGAQ